MRKFRSLIRLVLFKTGIKREPDLNLPTRTFASFDVATLPDEVKGFEDLIFLFSCSRATRGLQRLDLDEAAYLYRYVKSLQDPVGVEIGRFKGGSCLLIAAAMSENSRLISIDYQVETDDYWDKQTISALKSLNLENKVQLKVGDSKIFDTSGLQADFVFIDGDHRYEGVSADFEHWIGVVNQGGGILFHDNYRGQPGVSKLISELRTDERVKYEGEAASLIHFSKR